MEWLNRLLSKQEKKVLAMDLPINNPYDPYEANREKAIDTDLRKGIYRDIDITEVKSFFAKFADNRLVFYLGYTFQRVCDGDMDIDIMDNSIFDRGVLYTYKGICDSVQKYQRRKDEHRFSSLREERRLRMYEVAKMLLDGVKINLSKAA